MWISLKGLLLASVYSFAVITHCRAESVLNGTEVVDRIICATNYTAELFTLIGSVRTESDWKRIGESSVLRGVRLTAASHVDETSRNSLVSKEIAAVKPDHAEEKLHIGDFHLGMQVEDAYAVLLSRYSNVEPRLYLDDQVLCIADANGQDLVWANVKSRKVHWLTLTPPIVRRIVGFKTGSFVDLKRAVETKLDVSFTTDVVSKGEVFQQIGTIDTVDGETLRYFSGAMAAGEEFIRTVRKAVNQHLISEPTVESAIGGVIANAFVDAMQKDENTRNAKSPRFAPRGSLQLQWTKNAVQGDWNSSGGSRRRRLNSAEADFESLSSGLEGALKQLNCLSL